MSNNEKYDTPISGHEYDGIKEFDNPLPMWWLITFWGTIIFSAIYYFHYELSSGPSTAEELKQDLAQIQASQPKEAPHKEAGGADLNALVGNPQAIAAGQTVFQARCVACHGAKGEGQIGPNLTDNFWIHGKGTIAEIADVIAKGVAAKGMPAWETMLSGDEVHNVAAFVVSLKGTNPPNAKAPEGTEFKE